MLCAASCIKTKKQEEIPELWKMILDENYEVSSENSNLPQTENSNLPQTENSNLPQTENFDPTRISSVDGRRLDDSQTLALRHSVAGFAKIIKLRYTMEDPYSLYFTLIFGQINYHHLNFLCFNEQDPTYLYLYLKSVSSS